MTIIRKIALMILLASVVLVGCMSHHHTIGRGPSANLQVSKRQSYLLSVVPMGELDTKGMAKGSDNYEIYTRADVLDYCIALLTCGLISTRRVTVTR